VGGLHEKAGFSTIALAPTALPRGGLRLTKITRSMSRVDGLDFRYSTVATIIARTAA